MADPRFVILQYRGKAPSMAACTKCQLKFFTPATFTQDQALLAEEYLLDKFAHHQCEEKPAEKRDPWR